MFNCDLEHSDSLWNKEQLGSLEAVVLFIGGGLFGVIDCLPLDLALPHFGEIHVSGKRLLDNGVAESVLHAALWVGVTKLCVDNSVNVNHIDSFFVSVEDVSEVLKTDHEDILSDRQAHHPDCSFDSCILEQKGESNVLLVSVGQSSLFWALGVKDLRRNINLLLEKSLCVGIFVGEVEVVD